MFRQVQVISLPAAAEILHGIGHIIRLIGIPQAEDPVMREETCGDHPGNVIRPHPVEPFAVNVGRYEAGSVLYVHGVFFRTDLGLLQHGLM